MLQVEFETLFVAAAGLALLYYLGTGLAHWLPAPLHPYRWLVAPWVGFGLLSIVTQFLSNPPFALSGLQSGCFALVVATAINIVAAVRAVRLRQSADTRWKGAGKTYIWLAAISVGVFVLCVLPVWSYGYPNVIGENWDIEMYLPLGEYMKHYSQASLIVAPMNPLVSTLTQPPVSARTYPFSYFQAALGFLPLDTLHTFVPCMALVRALSIPATFVFFRVVLKLRPTTALFACAALGANAFLLWITYNSFAMQVPSFGLLPLALVATFTAMDLARDRGTTWREVWRACAWLGYFTGALAVAYNPSLSAYVAMAGPCVPAVIAVCVRNGERQAAGRVLVAIVVSGALGLALSLVSEIMSLNGFLKQYGERAGGMDLVSFASPGDALGVSLSFRPVLAADPGRPLMSLISRLYGAAGWVALGVAAGLMLVYLYGLKRSRGGVGPAWRWQVWALASGAVAYAILFVVPFNYTYGWFKALSFIAPVLVGMAAGGAERLMEIWRRRGARAVVLASGVSAAALMMLTTVLTVGMYWGAPVRFDRDLIEADSLGAAVASSGGVPSVYLANSPGMQDLGKVSRGLLSYYLRDAVLFGRYTTAYSALDNVRPNGIYDFTLLAANDHPAEYGAGDAKLVWHNSALSLYSLPSSGRTDLYHENYRDAKYPKISAGSPLTLTIEPDKLSLAGAPPVPTPAASDALQLRQFQLGLASMTTSTLRLSLLGSEGASRVLTLTVPPGYSAYQSDVVAAPLQVRVSLVPTGDTQSPVYLRWIHLSSVSGKKVRVAGLSADGTGMLLWVRSAESRGSSAANGNLGLRLDYVDTRVEATEQVLSLDLYARDGSSHFGYWNVSVPDNGRLSAALSLDLESKSLVVESGNTRVTDAYKGSVTDGDYVASMLVYQKGNVLEAYNDVFTFSLKGGKVSNFRWLKAEPIFK